MQSYVGRERVTETERDIETKRMIMIKQMGKCLIDKSE